MPESWLKLATIKASRMGLRYFRWKNGSSADTVSSWSDSAISATSASGLLVAQAAQHGGRLVATVALHEPARALGDAQQEQVEGRRGKRGDAEHHPPGRRTPGRPRSPAMK